MKKITFTPIVCFMLILISILFCGCSNVSYVNFKDDNGHFNEVIEITLDEQKFSNYPSISYVKNEITKIANSALSTKYREYEILINDLVQSCMSNPEKQHLANSYAELLDHVTWAEPKWTDNYFTCKLTFASTSAYLIYYELTETNFSHTETKEGFFYDTTYFKGTTGYAINKSLYATIKFALSKQFNQFSSEDISLSYSYLVKSSRYHSNANNIQFVGNNYYQHTWNITEQNMNNEIYFYLKLANRSAWYLLAIFTSLISLIILLSISLTLKLFKKHQKSPMDS